MWYHSSVSWLMEPIKNCFTIRVWTSKMGWFCRCVESARNGHLEESNMYWGPVHKVPVTLFIVNTNQPSVNTGKSRDCRLCSIQIYLKFSIWSNFYAYPNFSFLIFQENDAWIGYIMMSACPINALHSFFNVWKM